MKKKKLVENICVEIFSLVAGKKPASQAKSHLKRIYLVWDVLVVDIT